MKCPYCNKELGEKKQCVTSQCSAFGKTFSNDDLGKNSDYKSPSSDSSQNKETVHNIDINSKLQEIEQNVKLKSAISEDNSIAPSSNAGLYIFLAIIILFIIGFNFF